MYTNKLLILGIITILIVGSLGFVLMRPGMGGSGNGSDDADIQGNATAESLSDSASNDGSSIESIWQLILSKNETFADGEPGYGSAHLEFPITNENQLKIKMRVISELCTACGGNGKGEVTVMIIMPSGEVAHQNIYTQSADVNILQQHPQNGNWQIFIEGIAIGDDYRIGYNCQIYTLDSDEE
jgi:hypothetical protein